MERDLRFIDPSSNKVTPCIRCDKALDAVIEGSSQPHQAVVLTSKGQYGSTEFDPMDGSSIEVNLCDDCLVAVAQTHITSHPHQPKRILP